ncbi:MAG: chemotaxis protein CheB [Acidobacteriota bacterium]
MAKSNPRHPKASSKRRRKPAPPAPSDSQPTRAPVGSSFPIVGVGASAGGLEAFSQLLESLAPDLGLALVFVQHLAPTYASALPTLLSKSTSLPVLLVEDGVTVEPNHVYVIPPDKNMAILDGRLNLLPRADTVGRHLPIDYFFRSLADDQKNRAVGVLLSGTGSDGTLGLQAIKAEGGLTLVQSRESAKYDGMPASAINAEVADFVLPPTEMAGELARLGQHGYVRQPQTPIDTASPESESVFSKILITLRMETGIDFVHYKPTTIRRRIARRMALHKIESLAVYMRFLKENLSEISQLCQDLLINVTGFFRDPPSFDALQHNVFPQLLRDRARDMPIRIWVPGCSTGEEAYSLAIALLESMSEQAAGRAIQVFATDLNEVAIARARAGTYLENIAADVSPERLSRFFVPVPGGYQVSKSVRELCAFSRQDLTRDPPFSKIDLISCRNVLIYMGPVLQKIVIPTFHFALNPGGVLMLGNSETIGEFSDLFSLLDKTHKLYVKKSSGARLTTGFAMPQPMSLPNMSRTPTPAAKSDFELQRAADQIALARYAPASVVVDDRGEIIQFRGATGMYLEPASGAASLNLFKLARPSLLLELRSVLNRARDSAQPVRKPDVRFKTDDGFKRVNLEVIPIKPFRAANQAYFMVVFEPAALVGETKKVKVKARRTRRAGDLPPDQQAARLEEELAATKVYLETALEQQEHTNQELHGALEEIQSSNEELQSTNEELETAKEELQATNEELTTLNEELQNRNAELGSVNNDLVNVLTSVNIPILIVGPDLRIRRFTPPAETVLGLIPADVGRPLNDLNLRIAVPQLEMLLRQVMETLEVRTEEIQDRDGHWYSLRFRPYQTVDRRIDGVVLVLVDIDSSRRFLAQVEEARDYAQAIVETVREPLVILNGDLRVQTANRAFYKMFQITPEQTEHRLFYELGDRQWDLPRLRQLLEEIVPQNSRLEDYDVDAEFPQIGHKHLVLNARRIDRPSEAGSSILLAIEPTEK